MNLVVYELKATDIVQEIEVGSRPIFIEAIRPHLYKHLNPTGSLQIKILSETDDLLFSSEVLTIQSIHAATGAYFHGKVRFYIDASLAANTKYKVALTSSGYTFSESAYIGWCNGFDLKVVDNSYTPLGDLQDAMMFEIWERKRASKGIS